MFLTFVPVGVLYNYPAIEYIQYYFYLAAVVLFFIGFYTWRATKTNQYRLLHNILKILLLIGVFSLLFIDKSLILDKVAIALD